MSFGYTPYVCLATGTVNLYSVISPPVSSGSAEFPWVLFYYGIQAFAMGSPLRVESAFVCTLSIGTKTLSEPIFQDPSRWGHPFGSSLCTLYILDRNEGLSWLLFQVSSG